MPVVKESGPALPVGNSAGRGFHPRPERSTPAKYLLTLSLSAFYCRCSKSSSRRCRSSKSPDRLCRSATMPVGGCTPDRNDPPPPNPCSPISLEFWPSALPILMQSSGCRLNESGPALPVGNRAGRGFHPRPERSTPAKSPPTLPNSSSSPLPNPSYFRSSLQCSCVDGSFRSGVQPPTGTDPVGSRSSAQKRQPPPSPASAKPPPSAIIPPLPHSIPTPSPLNPPESSDENHPH